MAEKKWCFRSEAIKDFAKLEEERVEYIGEQNKLLIEVVHDIAKAVNNNKNYEKYKSYSKCLGVTLFKYYNSSSLVFMEKKIDSVRIKFEIESLEWSREEVLDITYFSYEEKRRKRAYELLREDFERGSFKNYDELAGVISELPISYVITGFTIDISDANRKTWNSVFDALKRNGKQVTGLKRQINYNDDQEVISTMVEGVFYNIQTPECMEILRFLYILMIYNLQEEYMAVKTAYFNKELGSFENDEVEAMKWVTSYLEEDISLEREFYHRVCYIRDDVNLKLQKNETIKEGTLRILDNMRKMNKWFKNENLFEQMKGIYQDTN